MDLMFFISLLQSNWNEIVDNFDDMNLKESLLRGIYAYGFEKPSAIQQRAIIPCIKGMQSIHQYQHRIIGKHCKTHMLFRLCAVIIVCNLH